MRTIDTAYDIMHQGRIFQSCTPYRRNESRVLRCLCSPLILVASAAMVLENRYLPSPTASFIPRRRPRSCDETGPSPFSATRSTLTCFDGS